MLPVYVKTDQAWALWPCLKHSSSCSRAASVGAPPTRCIRRFKIFSYSECSSVIGKLRLARTYGKELATDQHVEMVH